MIDDEHRKKHLALWIPSGWIQR